MRIILSAAISADGYLDDESAERLVLSSPEDWRRVHELRADCDAILVGAETIRRDDPALVICDENLRRRRVEQGRSADIMKVTVSASGKLSTRSRFFTQGDAEKVVFTVGKVGNKIADVATVVSRPEITASTIESHLRKMGVGKLMVEGGSNILSMFLREHAWDEFRLAVAPIFVGREGAPRLVLDGDYPPMTLVGVEQMGQTAVMHYVNRSQLRADCMLMLRAIDNSLKSTASEKRYRVGAVIKTLSGQLFDGYTGETELENHAEEEAIAKALNAGADLSGATMYCTIEPCSTRKSKAMSCSDLLIKNEFARVVFVLREPDRFARCEGVRRLNWAGIEVMELSSFAADIVRINAHVLSKTQSRQMMKSPQEPCDV